MKRKTAPAKISKKSQPPATAADNLATTVKLLTLRPGVYMLAIQSTGKPPATLASGVRLPAITVTLAPGMPPDRVEFLSSPSVAGHWVSSQDDLLIVKVLSNVTVAITSMRAPNQPEINASFEKLGASTTTTPVLAAAPSTAPAAAPAIAEPHEKYQRQPGEMAYTILAHIRGRGDIKFADVEWAGRIGQGHWIESFAVTPTEGLSAQDVEYKALTASGFESPWLSNSQPCGTRGMSIPVIGFAMRLKPSAETAKYDFEYLGYFQSGTTVGPLKNGAPCRSTIANDPLEGLQVRIIRKDHKALSTEVAAKPEIAKIIAPPKENAKQASNTRSAKPKASPKKSEKAPAKKGLLGRFRQK